MFTAVCWNCTCQSIYVSRWYYARYKLCNGTCICSNIVTIWRGVMWCKTQLCASLTGTSYKPLQQQNGICKSIQTLEHSRARTMLIMRASCTEYVCVGGRGMGHFCISVWGHCAGARVYIYDKNLIRGRLEPIGGEIQGEAVAPLVAVFRHFTWEKRFWGFLVYGLFHKGLPLSRASNDYFHSSIYTKQRV